MTLWSTKFNSISISGGDQEVLKLKRVKHELEMKLKEAEEELDEQAGTIQQLEQAKLKLEMQNSKAGIQHQKDLDLKVWVVRIESRDI